MTAGTIQQLLAPVVMISACGLLCMALYNRLANIVGRLRQFHHERLEAGTRVGHATGTDRELLGDRMRGLEEQSHAMIGRARFIRNALICLISCIICMLTSSLMIGLGLVVPSIQPLAVWLFILGVTAMLIGMILAAGELFVCLRQVESEHTNLERLDDLTNK